MDTSKTTGGSEIPWLEDSFPNFSTVAPDVVAEQTTEIGTVIIFVVSAIITISLLFGIAVFIDCRHQRLTQLQATRPRRKMRLKIPRIGRPVQVREDEDTLADKMQIPEPSTSHSPVLTV